MQEWQAQQTRTHTTASIPITITGNYPKLNFKIKIIYKINYFLNLENLNEETTTVAAHEDL